MSKHMLVGALALTAMVGIAAADNALKSGPQPGNNIPGPFHPLNLTGAKAGEKNSLV